VGCEKWLSDHQESYDAQWWTRNRSLPFETVKKNKLKNSNIGTTCLEISTVHITSDHTWKTMRIFSLLELVRH
jgi:hypothetical protein